MGRRNTSNAKAEPGKVLLYRDVQEAAGSVYVHGNKTSKGTWCLRFPFGRRLYSRDASLSAGTGVLSNKPGKEYRMQGTYSSDEYGLPSTVLLPGGPALLKLSRCSGYSISTLVER